MLLSVDVYQNSNTPSCLATCVMLCSGLQTKALVNHSVITAWERNTRPLLQGVHQTNDLGTFQRQCKMTLTRTLTNNEILKQTQSRCLRT